jgi:hypothetical protein
MKESAMTTSARVACALLGLVVGIGPVLAGEEEGVEAKVAFARLKKLEGEWKVAGHDEHDKSSKIIYKVTAAGSSLMETEHPGSSHEMVTIYHLDGKNLLATHYCAAGNQPRLKLDLKGSKPDLYSFVFDGGTNLDASKDMHIHGLRIKFLEDGKVEAEWDGFIDGKLSDTVKFVMSRP